MVWQRRLAVVSLILLASCGASSAASPTAATTTPTVSALIAVAALTFPECGHQSCRATGSKFTTCDGGETGKTVTSRFSLCPFTARLDAQLGLDANGGDAGGGPADPVGGAQDPEWPTQSVTATPSSTGGTATVTSVDGVNTFDTVLVIVRSGGHFLVDDIYCAGTNPTTTDAYAAGWDLRAACLLG